MLTIYSGYHLANKHENITLDIRELQPQQEIIDMVTEFVTTSETLEDDIIAVGLNTTNPLVIATIEAIAMEKNKIHNLKYVYITEDGEEHISHYVEDRCDGDAYYARKRCK